MIRRNIKVTSVKLYLSSSGGDNGLVAFASCILNYDFFLNGIGVYKKLSDGYRVTFPKRRDSHGKAKDIFYPINKRAYKSIADEIISEYLKII